MIFIVVGLSDFRLVLTVLRSSFKKLPPKEITYRSYKNFTQKHFLRDLDRRLIQGEIYKNCNDPYKKLTEIFFEVLDKHAPLKKKKVRGNNAVFMSKELSKAIMTKYT